MHKYFCTWTLFNTYYLIWEYFPCLKNTFNKLLPREKGTYWQFELSREGVYRVFTVIPGRKLHSMKDFV